MYINTENYKKQIDKKGLKVDHLIDKTMVSRATFYKYIKGEIEVTADFVLLLSRELVCPINYLTVK